MAQRSKIERHQNLRLSYLRKGIQIIASEHLFDESGSKTNDEKPLS